MKADINNSILIGISFLLCGICLGIDKTLQEHIMNEIVDKSPSVTWNDIGNHILSLSHPSIPS